MELLAPAVLSIAVGVILWKVLYSATPPVMFSDYDNSHNSTIESMIKNVDLSKLNKLTNHEGKKGTVTVYQDNQQYQVSYSVNKNLDVTLSLVDVQILSEIQE